MRPARKRELVDDVRTIWKVSIRRACRNLGVDTSSYHYRSRRPSQASLKQRIKEIAETRVRYGYRRIHVLLRREGWLVNAKRVNRHYREGPAIAQQVAEAEGQGQAARGSQRAVAWQ